MTVKDQAENIANFVNGFEDLVADTFEKTIRNLDTEIQVRVFDNHEDVNGALLGNYSTKPMLIGAKSFANTTEASQFFTAEKAARKKASKVTGGEKSQWRTVKSKRLYLLDGGYKELREIQGRPSGTINLQYTFELEKSGIVVDFSKGYQIRFANVLSTKKGRGFEETHNKTVFKQSEEEGKKALDYISTQLRGALQECFS